MGNQRAIHNKDYRLNYLSVDKKIKNADALVKRVAPSSSNKKILSESQLESKYANVHPSIWSDHTPGMIKSIRTDKKVMALTFDACGNKGDGYDKELIDYLIQNKIPATLFFNSRWVAKNPQIAKQLAKNPLFEIENHGTEHKPLSVSGKSAYHIQGTKNIKEIYEEIEGNAKKLEKLTGKRPKYFRAGTAYVDNVSVKIAEDLGTKLVGFDLLGDAGATFSKSQIEKQMKMVKPGTIAIFHMNRPKGYTYEGLKESLPELKKKGYQFVKLKDMDKNLSDKP